MKLGVLSSTNGSSNITIGQHRVLTRFNQENTWRIFFRSNQGGFASEVSEIQHQGSGDQGHGCGHRVVAPQNG